MADKRALFENTLFTTVAHQLVSGRSVKIDGLGTFVVEHAESFAVAGDKDSDARRYPPSDTVVFRPE